MRIGVIGYSGDIYSEKILALKDISLEVGREIARRNHILISGGRDGIMYYVSKGCKEAGGITVGVLPFESIEEGNEFLTLPLTTGLSMDMRSNIMISSVDAIIMLGGEIGTLYELILSYIHKKIIAILNDTGGWADRIQSVLYDGKYLDSRKLTNISLFDSSFEALDYIEYKFLKEAL